MTVSKKTQIVEPRLVMAVVLAINLPVGAVAPIDAVTYEDSSTVISGITVGEFTFNADELLHGFSEPFHEDIDDLDVADGSFGNSTFTTSFDTADFVGGFFRDANGPNRPDFFLFESSGGSNSDPIEIVFAIYSLAGSPHQMGEPISFASGPFPTGDWGLPGGVSINGQDVGGIAFALTDLRDDQGIPLPSHALLHAIFVSDPSGGLDAVSFCAHVTHLVAVTQSGQDTAVAEEGQTIDTVTLALTKQPAAPVTLTLNPLTGADDFTLNGAPSDGGLELTFTSSDWDVPQTVTITAVDDGLTEGQETAVLLLDLGSSNPEFDDRAGPTLLVTIIDNDIPCVAIVESAGATVVEEGGPTDTYTLALTFAPTAPVAIGIDDPADPPQLNASPLTLTFTTENWATPQTVTVEARDDDLAEPHPHAASLFHTATSEDAGYQGLLIGVVNVAIGEDDCGAVAADLADVNQDRIDNLQDFALFTAEFFACSIALCD